MERAATKEKKAIHGDGKVEEEIESLKKTEGLTLFSHQKLNPFDQVLLVNCTFRWVYYRVSLQ